jgi:hypothetical protein
MKNKAFIFQILLIIFILAQTSSFAQLENKIFKNSIFVEGFNYRTYSKKYKSSGSYSLGFMINYYGTIYMKDNYKLKGEVGFGFFPGSEGFPYINSNLYIKNYFGKNIHHFISGLGLNYVQGSGETEFLGSVGYNIKIFHEISANISFNQVLWYYTRSYDEYTNDKIIYENWIWNSNSNRFWIYIGFGINF